MKDRSGGYGGAVTMPWGEKWQGHLCRSLDEVTEQLESMHWCGWAGGMRSCHQRVYLQSRILKGEAAVGKDKVKTVTMERGG